MIENRVERNRDDEVIISIACRGLPQPLVYKTNAIYFSFTSVRKQGVPGR